MNLIKPLFFLVACIPLNGFPSEHSGALLERIGKQLKLSGIESFQSLKIEKSELDFIVDVDISTTSVTSEACITKVAQLIFSDNEVDEIYEDQLWLGSCEQAHTRNAISIDRSADVKSLVQLMLDAKDIFLADESFSASRYAFERNLLKYKGSASDIVFISALTNKKESVLNFAIEVDKKKVFLEITSASLSGTHKGKIRSWNPEFDFKD